LTFESDLSLCYNTAGFTDKDDDPVAAFVCIMISAKTLLNLYADLSKNAARIAITQSVGELAYL